MTTQNIPIQEKTIELPISQLLPGIHGDDDGCLVRLEQALQTQQGISRAHLEREQRPACLCLHYDPAQVSPNELRHTAEQAGATILNRYHHRSMALEGLDCSDCALVVEHGLGRMQGVTGAHVDYAGQVLHVEYDARRTSPRQIRRRVRQLGYHAPSQGVGSWLAANRELLFSLSAGVLLLAGWLGETLAGLPHAAALGFYLAAYALGGYDPARHALHTLRERRFDTDLLMLLAAAGAAALGEWGEGALLLFLFSLGHALEERALDHARNAVRALAALAPKTALVRRDGKEILTPVEQVVIGDAVVLRPGVRSPVDGEVTAGNSAVDQSPVTGESIPVEKGPGDRVFAGSINGDGALELRATRLARDSTLARVMGMVEEAQAQQSPTQQVTERFTRIFVPAVLALVAGMILLPPMFGVPFHTAFLRAMAVLVAASPCALALGTPAAVLSGIAQAARGGVLVKGGAHLENLGRLRAIAFDKTGTLTHGRPQVTGVEAFGAYTPEQALALAAAVEGRSAHPLAQAVWKEAAARGLSVPPAGESLSFTGRGIRAQVEGQAVIVGSLRFLEEAGFELAADAAQRAAVLEEQAQSVLLVGMETPQGRHVIGLISVSDPMRPGAPAALAALEKLGVRHILMLSGDNPRTAEQIARQAGLRQFRAGLMPEDKVQVVRDMVGQHGVVGMVGDGVNDAPALAHATVGIAMGEAATDVALETADVALMSSDLGRLPYAVGLGRATRRIILQNLVLAMGTILALSALAFTGAAGIGAAVLFHEGSTLLVVLNALRLFNYRTAG